jgi:5-methylcytosine-specific restriction enzyme subunit McrC
MSRLFELFVARWLRENIPSTAGLSVAPQEKYLISAEGDVHFRIDIVLKDSRSHRPVCVVDTKYKADPFPSSDDLAQVIAYATAEDCDQAILVYPAPGAALFDRRVGRIRVRSLSFALEGDLEDAGARFAGELLKGLRAND